MKTPLLALGLIATSMGFANNEHHDVDNNACPSSCCAPCCTSPTPCSSIDCTCFTPQWYNMTCDCGFFASVDFLYFYGRETNLSYAAKLQTVSNSTSTLGTTNLFASPVSLEHLDAKWDPGVRVGIGWNMPCDGWDLSFYWTYYYNTSKQSKSVDNPTFTWPALDGFAFINQWRNSVNTANLFDNVVSSVKGEWKLRYNNFDLVMGKRYWLSKCFTLRPYMGLRGFWTETDFTVDTSRPSYTVGLTMPQTITIETTDDFTNDSWGVGFVGGIQPTWFFTPCFSLYGGFGMALGWGDHKVKKRERYPIVVQNGSVSTTTGNYVQNFSASHYYMTPMLDMELGLRWENYYCDNEYHLQIDLGWEHHVLFHLNDRYQVPVAAGSQIQLTQTTFADGNLTYSETHHDVSFGGLVIRVRFDF